MLSKRGEKTANQLDIPWLFVGPGPQGRYDAETNPSGVVTQFTSAENWLTQKELVDFTSEKARVPWTAFGYSTSDDINERLSTALAEHLNEEWKPCKPLVAEDISNFAAATAVHEILGFTLLDPGQGILISRPYYGRFELDFGNKADVNIVPVDTPAAKSFQPGCVDAFEDALQKSNAAGVQIKAVLIINPHNPLGRSYPKETLIALMKFCQKHQLHLISDEIYAQTEFDSGEPDTVPFTSVFSVEPHIDDNLLHVIYGLSKAYAIPGLRLGSLITRSKPLIKSFTSLIRFHDPSGPAITIATAMLEDREWLRGFLDMSRGKIAEAYKYFTQELNRLGIKYLPGSNAGLFVWVDLSPYLVKDGSLSKEEREQELAQRTLDKGIALQPGEEHALEAGWFRFVYTVERGVVEEGLRRLAGALGLEYY